MFKTIALFGLIFLATLTSCDSPIDVDANRNKSVSGINDNEQFLVAVYNLYRCPGSNDIAALALFHHKAFNAKDYEISSVLMFHETANVVIGYNPDTFPLLIIDPDNPSGEVHFPKARYLTISFPDGATIPDIEDIDIRVVVNGNFANTATLQELYGESSSIAFGEGEFDIDFGDVAIGESSSDGVPICHHCNQTWVFESYTFEDPENAFSFSGPEAPVTLKQGDNFNYTTTFSPVRSGLHSAKLTLNFRTDEGKRFQTIVNYTGIGE